MKIHFWRILLGTNILDPFPIGLNENKLLTLIIRVPVYPVPPSPSKDDCWVDASTPSP